MRRYYTLPRYALSDDEAKEVIESSCTLPEMLEIRKKIRQIRSAHPLAHFDVTPEDELNICWLCAISLHVGFEMGRKAGRRK